MTHGLFVFVLTAGIACCGCGRRGAKFPPPVYQEPELPVWQPEEQEEADPFADLGAMDGEWVNDSVPDEPLDAEGQGLEDRPSETEREGDEADASTLEPDDRGEGDEESDENPQTSDNGALKPAP